MPLEVRSRLTMATACGGVALGAVVLAREAGARLASGAITGAASVVLGLAVLGAGRSVAHAWWGPAVISFRRDESVLCEPREAAAVRAAAQLRGTLGGAGHVQRGRLALSTAAWLAVGGFAWAALVERWRHAAVCCGGLALVLALVAARFPALPFFYREAMGGRLVVHPPGALDELVGAAPDGREAPSETPAPTPAAGVEAGDGWGTSLSPPETGRKPPQLPADGAP